MGCNQSNDAADPLPKTVTASPKKTQIISKPSTQHLP